MDALEDRVYGCDICQDVCPWNRGVERRRADDVVGDATPSVSLVEWLERDGATLVQELDRLFVPKNDPRWLRRNALVALGNVGRAGEASQADAFVADDDATLRSVAARAVAKIAERSA
jgi:epoxyqueuosine reductase